MEKQDVAILYSGGKDSLALYAVASFGVHPEITKARKVHLLHMLNGMGRFPEWPRKRYEIASKILRRQVPLDDDPLQSTYIELDTGRLFQGLWLDWYEDLMPKYGGKNLVCVACKLAMHAKAILYCMEHYVPLLLVGYTRKQGHYPEQTPTFMDKLVELSQHFGIKTMFPLYDEFGDEDSARHFLEEFGLPSTGGGERKCLFCQTKTSATEKEIGSYLDDMIPVVRRYMAMKIGRNIKGAAECFPPGVPLK